MNDLAIFGMGVIVTIFVACAVGILIWGAAQEPSEGEVPEEHKWTDPNPAPARANTSQSRVDPAHSDTAA